MKRRKIIRHSAAYLALGVLIIIALFPYFWMITCAIRDQNEIFTVSYTHLTLPTKLEV